MIEITSMLGGELVQWHSTLGLQEPIYFYINHWVQKMLEEMVMLESCFIVKIFC